MFIYDVLKILVKVRLSTELGDVEVESLNGVWCRFRFWSDMSVGFLVLCSIVFCVICSNGSFVDMVPLVEVLDIEWDVVFGSEVLGFYKFYF